jgi:regulatory protein
MKKKLRKIPTPQSLANVALHYLGRYAASEASLRRVLVNRLRRAAMDHCELAADIEGQSSLRSAIETIIERHKKAGSINDASFAETKINRLRRQGRSRHMIGQTLAKKGIAVATVAAALEQNADGVDSEEIELKAALILARRRRLGPFGKKPADKEQQRKDYATLARAGFSFAIVQRVLKLDHIRDWD